jgi:hypothetical protein
LSSRLAGATKDWYENTLAKDSRLVNFVPSIGQSHGGRDLYAVHITGAADPSTVKKFFWDCGT